jgi:hypothetical protein
MAKSGWRVTVARSLDARALVFVDEMGTNTSLSPVYGWSKKGRRAHRARYLAIAARIPPCLPA